MAGPDCCRDTETWGFTQTRLRFMAGEFCLFSWRLRALVYRRHFTRSPLAADEIRPPLEGLPPRIAAVCMQSYPLHAPQPRIAFLNDAIRYTPFHYRQYYVALSGTFEQYLAKFNSKHRTELKRALRRFEAASGGAIDIRAYTSPSEMSTFHRLALAVSVRTYQHRLIDTGIPTGEEFAAWLRDSAENGRVVGYVLFLAGAPVAFEYSSITPDGIIIGERMGYDPSHSRLAPGIVLLCCVIRGMLDEHRFRLLDFGGGEARYKACFLPTPPAAAISSTFGGHGRMRSGSTRTPA